MPRISFSRFLGEEEQRHLHDIGQWRFISTLGPKRPPSLRNRRYERIKEPQNLHAPAHREALLVLRGEGIFCLDGTLQRLQPGTVLLFDHYETRSRRRPPSLSIFDHLWIHLLSRNSMTFNTNSRDASGRMFRALPNRAGSEVTARQLMDTWDHCRANPTDGMAYALLKSRIATTFLEILGTATAEPPPNHHQKIVASVQEHIREHLMEDLSLERLSDISGYSPFFFHRLFLKYTGKTPGEFVTTTRLERAKRLLLENYTVEATAERIGIASLSYFNRLFRKATGQTPAGWRAAQPFIEDH